MEYFFQAGDKVQVLPVTSDDSYSFGRVVRELPPTAWQNTRVLVMMDKTQRTAVVAKINVNPID